MRLRAKLGFAAVCLVGFFALAELALLLVGVEPLIAERDPFRGFSASMRVFEESEGSGRIATSPRASRSSFNAQSFLARKPANGLRIFTLGGSSAYGYPWGERVAFTTLLGEALADALPGRSVEAVNASGMSYASHRLRILANEVLTYEPDLLILFSGHNEFVETRFYDGIAERSEVLDPLRHITYRWRFYAALTRAMEAVQPAQRPDASASVGSLLGLDVPRETTLGTGEQEKASAADRFEANLEAILDAADDAGVAVVLCTVPSNLRHWKPGQSLFAPGSTPDTQHRVGALLARGAQELASGRPAQALKVLEEARRLAPEYAATHFGLGLTYETLGRDAAALDSYRAARDRDMEPARALSRFNEILRRLARERDLPLVDAVQLFERASPRGLTGFELIADYVHPTEAGHVLIARALFAALFAHEIVGAAGEPPLAIFEQAVARVRARPSTLPAKNRVALLFNMGVVLQNQGLLDQAVARYGEILEVVPHHHPARRNRARAYQVQRQHARALVDFRTLLESDPRSVIAWVGSGTSLTELGRADEAEAAFRRALALDRRHSGAWAGLGALLLRDPARSEQAEQALRRAIELDPDDSGARSSLARLQRSRRLP